MNEILIKTSNGKLRGRIMKDYKGRNFYSFQGIPYAQPPIGNLRFKAPLPAKSWKGIRDATKEANVSVSKDDVQGNIIGSEDCLYLNVYTPEFSKTQSSNLKPVLFWIHGGAYVSGSGSTELYGPEYLMTEDIILVTINYRLGVLGFLNLNDPALEVPGNAAMKDVVLALRWVHNNIIYFCGDNGNITVAGHSAGAVIAHYLMLSPMTKNLFHRLILQSGSALSSFAFGKENSKKIAQVLGYQGDSEKDILEYLHSVSIDKLIEGQEKMRKLSSIPNQIQFAPIIENTSCKSAFITEHPIDIIKSGNYNKVPVLIGYTANEGIISEVLYDSADKRFENFTDFQYVIPFYFNIPRDSVLSFKIAKKIENYYLSNCKTNKDKLKSYYTLQTDVLVLLGLYLAINTHIQNLNHSMFFYRISYDTTLNVIKNKCHITTPGTCHGDELGYLFKNVYTKSIKNDSVEAKAITTMIKVWSNFIKNGDPISKEHDDLKSLVWEPVKPGKYNFVDINTKLSSGVNLDIERMKIWDEISLINTNQSKF